MKKIFVAYQRRAIDIDKLRSFCATVDHQLRERRLGFQTWFADRDLDPARIARDQDPTRIARDQIIDAIRESQFFLAVMSHVSWSNYKSVILSEEELEATDRARTGRTKIFNILFGSAEVIPGDFRDYDTFDFSMSPGDYRWNAAMNRLIDAIS